MLQVKHETMIETGTQYRNINAKKVKLWHTLFYVLALSRISCIQIL